MNVSGTEFLQRMNCSFYVNRQLLHDNECNCPLSCKETIYKHTMTQSPWPQLSYHLPLYTDYIRQTEFADYFSEYYEPLVDSPDADYLIYEELKKTDLISRNFIQVHVKMDSDLLVKYVEKEALSWESFVGGLGGLLNLWTGISFFAILEIVELVYRLVWPSEQDKTRVSKSNTKTQVLPTVS